MKPTRSSSKILALTVILLGGLMIASWSGGLAMFQGRLTSAAGVLVLDDCDSDFRTLPFQDAVIMFGSDGKPFGKVNDLNLCQTVGGCRSLSVAENGQFFVVCQNVGDKISAYAVKTGEKLWSLDGEFTAAAVSRDGTVYALHGTRTINGDQVRVIDQNGRFTRHALTGGFDLALDADHDALWLVGKSIKKCDLNDSGLKVLLEVHPIKWCAVSVDVNPDGSIWVAERQHPNVALSTNRIVKISSTGQILNTVGLPWSPICLRVDRTDGSVWVTGTEAEASAFGRFLNAIEKQTGHLPTGKWLRDRLTRRRISSGTYKFDKKGTLLHEIGHGGFSIDIDQVDGSLWLAGLEKVYHYSREGKKLAQGAGVSDGQKYIAVVPQAHRGEPGEGTITPRFENNRQDP